MKINWRYMKHTRKSQITNNISTSCPVVHILSTMDKKEKLVKIAGSSRHQQCLHKKISWIVGWLRRIARTRQWVVWARDAHSLILNLSSRVNLAICHRSPHSNSVSVQSTTVRWPLLPRQPMGCRQSPFIFNSCTHHVPHSLPYFRVVALIFFL